MTLLERNRAAGRVCFGLRPADADLRLLGSRERWLLYRALVRNRIREMLGNGLSRTAEALGDRFDRTFDLWLAEDPPRTRFIREVIPLFADFALPRWRAEDVPPFLLELATYETTAWVARYMRVDERLDAAELDFERVPAVNPTARVMTLDHPVNDWKPGDDPPPARPTHVIVYRNLKTHRSSGWVMNDMSEAIMRRLMAGDLTLTEAVRQAAEERKVDITPRFIESLGQMLADYLERTILLGSKP